MPRRIARAAPAIGAALLVIGATTPPAPDHYVRDHEHGQTSLRFEKGHFHFALVLDGRPSKNEDRDLVTASGRRVRLDWSGRSIWIDRTKFELPFGAVFLVTTRDSTRAQQLDFNTMSGRLLLDQAATAPAVAEWLGPHRVPGDAVTRAAVQAATYPRHTLELAEWSYHGVNAVTCVVSGEPLFVLFSEASLHGVGSTQTTFGNLAGVDVQVGDDKNRRTWHATRALGAIADSTYDFSRGTVFVIPASGGNLTQVKASLDLGPESASRITDEIERLPQVRKFLRLE